MKQNLSENVKKTPPNSIKTLKDHGFHIRSKRVSKILLNQELEEANFWNAVSNLDFRPNMVPQYFGAYLEDCPDNQSILHLVFESNQQTYDILLHMTHLMNPGEVLDKFYWMYVHFFDSLVSLQKINLCPYLITPNLLFLSESGYIQSHYFVFAENYVSRIMKEYPTFTEEEKFYIAPEIKLFKKDIDPYKSCIYSIALVLMDWNVNKSKIKYYEKVSIEYLLAEFERAHRKPEFKKCVSVLRRWDPEKRPNPSEVLLTVKEIFEEISEPKQSHNDLSNNCFKLWVSSNKNFVLKFEENLGILSNNGKISEWISKIKPLRNLTFEQEYNEDASGFIDSNYFQQNFFDRNHKIKNFCIEFCESNDFKYFDFDDYASKFIERNHLKNENWFLLSQKVKKVQAQQSSSLIIRNLAFDPKSLSSLLFSMLKIVLLILFKIRMFLNKVVAQWGKMMELEDLKIRIDW